MNDTAQPGARRFSRRQVIWAGGIVTASIVGWVYLRSRISASEPPLVFYSAGDRQATDFLEALQGELRRLGARQTQVVSTVAKMHEHLAGLSRGVYGIVAAGPSRRSAGRLVVIAEVRDAAWQVTLWTHRGYVSTSEIQSRSEYWYTMLASTMASASRGGLSAKLRANPGAARIFEESLRPHWDASLPPLETASSTSASANPQLEGPLREALRIDPAFYAARAELAMYLAKASRWEEAKTEALKAMEGDERLWSANYALGLCQLQLGDQLAGCRYLARCLELSPLRLEPALSMPASCAAGRDLVEDLRSVFPKHAGWTET